MVAQVRFSRLQAFFAVQSSFLQVKFHVLSGLKSEMEEKKKTRELRQRFLINSIGLIAINQC